MDKYRFYKNTVSVLDLIKNGRTGFLVDEGWVSREEMSEIMDVITNLDYVRVDAENQLEISDKGLKTLESFQSDDRSDLLDEIVQTISTVH